MPAKMLPRFVVVLAMAAIAVSRPLVAQAPLNIKLATLAPESSPWTSAIRSMGASWSKATGSRVRLTVYAGTIPSESSAIARMAVDGLQAAALTAGGLAEVDEAFNVFGVPFFFESDGEGAYVQEKLTPMIAQRLEARKFHLLNWGNAGWVQVFSKSPIRSIADLKRARLYTGEGSPKSVQWYTNNGFHVVPLSAGEIPKQLKLPTGAIVRVRRCLRSRSSFSATRLTCSTSVSLRSRARPSSPTARGTRSRPTIARRCSTAPGRWRGRCRRRRQVLMRSPSAR